MLNVSPSFDFHAGHYLTDAKSQKIRRSHSAQATLESTARSRVDLRDRSLRGGDRALQSGRSVGILQRLAERIRTDYVAGYYPSSLGVAKLRKVKLSLKRGVSGQIAPKELYVRR